MSVINQINILSLFNVFIPLLLLVFLLLCLLFLLNFLFLYFHFFCIFDYILYLLLFLKEIIYIIYLPILNQIFLSNLFLKFSSRLIFFRLNQLLLNNLSSDLFSYFLLNDLFPSLRLGELVSNKFILC